MSSDFLAALRGALPGDRVLTDDSSLGDYSHDDAEWADFTLPLAVVRARTTAEVSTVVRLAGAAGVRGCAARRRDGAVRRGQRDRRLHRALAGQDGPDPGDRPGRPPRRRPARRGQRRLSRAVAEHGLWYPPDPASSTCTIGGNVGTTPAACAA